MFSPDENALFTRMARATLLGACAALIAQPSFGEVRLDRLTPAEQAVYRERVQALLDGPASNREVYEPLERVPGATRVTPLPERGEAARTIAAEALDAAAAYAKDNNSNAFIVWRDGAIEYEAYYGDTDRDSPIVSRSLSKPMAAIAVGRAIALGRITGLDQRVADFLPEWRGTPKAAITVRHLLDMRAGFLQQGPVSDPESIWTRAYLSPRHEDVIIGEYPLTHAPGTRYNYSNATTDLIAVLIERATGRRYAEFISTEVLAPVGAPGGSIWINRPDGVAHSGCCLLIPAQSWLRLGVLLMNDGSWQGRRLLPEGYVAEMKVGTRENVHAGLGVYTGTPYAERRGAANPDLPIKGTLHSEPYLAQDLYLFDGNANQVVYIVPSERLVILRTGDAPRRSPEWDNAFLPNTLLRGLKR